jgi:arylsulfatase A-like enzyme
MAPNIVLIVVDDLGWRDLTCYGSSFYETPNLDRLAGEGLTFTDAYASAPVCSPTRASLLTGKYPVTVGVTDWIGGHSVGRLCDVPYFAHLPLSEWSLANALKAGGYRTWHVGKWHLGSALTWPEKHGFDVNIGGCHWGLPQSYTSPYACPTLTDGPDGEYLTDRLTDEAIALLSVPNPEGRPFFLNLWHYAVHTPIQSPPELVAKYEAKARSLGLDQEQAIETGEEMPGWHLAGQHVQRRVVQSDPRYAAMIENLDTNVGRLLDALEARGQADDTLVIFTSDNGGLSSCETSPTCNAPLAEGKGWMYDGGIRVPLIVRWPGVLAAGGSTTVPTTSPDVYPTLLDVAGLDRLPEQHRDGVSLMPLLQGGELDRGPLFWHYPHYGNQGGTPAAAVRDGRWKLIRFYEDESTELYDLVNDVSEGHDMAYEQPEIVRELATRLDEWLAATEAMIPAANPRART